VKIHKMVYKTKELFCDFCGNPDPKWAYPVDDFSQNIHPDATGESADWNSIGGWSSCSNCKELIDANKRQELAWRCIHNADDVPNNNRIRAALHERILILHEEFFAMRAGDAMTEEDYSLAYPDEEPGTVVVRSTDPKDNING